MSVNCIEDGFEYQIEQAIKDIINNYDDKDEFLEQVDGGIDFANSLYERAIVYTDVIEIANKIWDKKNART